MTDQTSLVRGMMVVVDGLKSRGDLNGKCALVLSHLPTETGRIPLGMAPLLPDDPLELIAVKRENAVFAPHDYERLSTAWNNLAFAYKRSGKYVEAGAAYETALDFLGGERAPCVINNLIKLCMTMLRENACEPRKMNERIGGLLSFMFEPITSLPEFRGLDCNVGIDFAPGYPARVPLCGIVNSVDAQPARTSFSRLFVLDEDTSTIVEVKPEDGKRLEMSAFALAALRQPRGKALRESELSFSGSL